MCPLSDEEANMLFVAKCEDLKRLPTEVQRDRFVRLLRNSCRGSIFDLGESGVGPIAMTVLEDILLKYNQFSVLKLASNILRDKGSMSIASFLRRGGGSIVHIDLRSNDIGPLGAAELFNSLKGNQLLGSIDLSSIAGANRNHIGSAAASFADLIANNEIISSINLESNSLTVEGLTSIAQALAASNISLSTIELSSNTFGPDGAALIGALLPNTKLLHIGFSSNDIGDKGAIAIARGLFEAPEEVITQIEKKRQDQREKRKKQRERLGLPDKDDLDDSDDDEDLEAVLLHFHQDQIYFLCNYFLAISQNGLVGLRLEDASDLHILQQITYLPPRPREGT
ncbi:MAG: putative leucine Rich Repeat family protein, partial [Streblomastix strix]